MIENKSAVTPADAGPVHCPVGRLPEPVESWRKLALQFDAQRMAALIHLRTLLDFPEAHAKVAREFLAAAPQPAERVPLTDRERVLLDALIKRELDHAAQCDGIANRTMAERQKGWDLERVALLQKLAGIEPPNAKVSGPDGAAG